ncbi:MAG: FAD-dependent oxidoreductase [Proteobacteria bacterium]|nr:FAD-dependent oxidoreductase [Pseudomonadota bacterium]
MNRSERHGGVVVVGGGLGGLVSAIHLAEGGEKVTLFESGKELGGRAITRDEGSFRFNLGPRALYCKGAAAATLDQWGIELTGGIPRGSGGLVMRRGKVHALPAGMLSLLKTSAFTVSDKVQIGRLLASLLKLNPQPLRGVSVAEWLDDLAIGPGPRALMEALVRLTTYVHAPHLVSAGFALGQIQLALGHGVRYLDGGWQRMVERLAQVASDAGVTIRRGASISGLVGTDAVRGVRLQDGTEYGAEAVFLAVAPGRVSRFLQRWDKNPIHKTLDQLIAVRMSCLDIGLDSLPRPKSIFALGLDEPTYFSVHSHYAALAEGNRALIHVAAYLAPDQHSGDVEQLEAVLDLVQPTWRDREARRFYYPGLTVAHAVPLAENRGCRVSNRVPGLPGVYLVGDWVGDEGMLADAVFASARRAARQLTEQRCARAA